MRKRHKRRLLGTTTQWVNRACFPNHVWSYDFVFDQGLAIQVGRSLTAGDVIRILEALFREHGRPA